ncbi:uncharacterized protein LOC125191836 [Salvia hispanica]|uniref:uncharacterized protein LOC125191836 n=1 Tax=Salvia hispanica TaxID=49212 RepID=UPI0020094236|nr:uncharacterized protein LOC125191836 [Salvia hispanica]
MVSTTDCTQILEVVKTKLDSTMPLIGQYIAVATFTCVMAIFHDFLNSCMDKRYWQKCKLFSLNAFSLTVLAVAMKLPVDLTFTDITDYDQFARVCSLAFMSICINYFMISLGSMEDNEIAANIAALGLLVITITVNVCIHIVQMVPSIPGVRYMLPQQILSLAIMLLSLAMSCSMSLMVPSAKRYIELKYNEKHRLVLTRQVNECRQVNESIDEVEMLVKGYWVMAETASLQFVLYANNYSSSLSDIVLYQFIGVIVGSIGPLSRWFTAWTIKVTETEQKSFRDEIKILLVSAGKVVLLLSVIFWREGCFRFCKNLREGGTESSRDGDFSQYVILLEGESQLPDKMVKRICRMADRMIRDGEKHQPKSLIRLVRKSTNFSGVVQFDNNQEVPSLCSQEPPNCWSLPLVTLTIIALALTNTRDDEANQLLASVTEGLSIVKLIEKTLDKNGELESIIKAVDAIWIGVEVYKKWDGKDLDSMSVRGATHKETLQNLSDVAKQIVTKFVAQPMHDPLKWPSRVIAANSMYRITQSILVRVENGEHQSDDELFGSISITIADILSACLTNLLRVIRLKCHENDFRKRHDSVGRAARLLGESKEILEILQQRELPRLDVEKAGNIDEWRASMAPDIENPMASPSTSSDNATSPLAPPSTSSENAISPLAPPSTSADNATSPLASPSASSENATSPLKPPSTSGDTAISPLASPSASSDNATIVG